MELKNAVVFCGRGKSPKYVEASSIEVINQACIYWDGIKRDNIKFVDENSNYSSSLIQAGDLLINSTGTGTLGRAAVFQGDSNASVVDSHVTVVRLKTEEYLPGFLCYYFRHKPIQERLYSKCVNGSTNQIELSKEKLLHFEIPDLDVEEQTKIFDVLEKVQQLIVMRQKQIDVLDNLIKARFVELFGEYFMGHINEKELDEVCNFIDYRGKTPEKSDEGIPLITAKNVKDNKFFIDPQEFIPEENYDDVMTRGIPRVNDVLFTTEAPLGNVCRIPDVYEKFCVGQRLITMQPHDDILNSEYLEYALASPEFQDKMWQKSSGSTVKGIRSKLLVLLTIPVPPMAIQEEFKNFLHQVDKSKVVVQKSLDETQKLFDSLMQEYFG